MQGSDIIHKELEDRLAAVRQEHSLCADVRNGLMAEVDRLKAQLNSVASGRTLLVVDDDAPEDADLRALVARLQSEYDALWAWKRKQPAEEP